MKKLINIGLFLLLLVSTSEAWALSIPEKLEYDLKWIGLKAGSAAMDINRNEDNEDNTVRIVSTAESADWVSMFYPVEDRVESLLASESQLYPTRYHLKTREGNHRKDKEVVFDREKNKALYTDNIDGEKREYDVPENIYDPLSAFYRIREFDLVVGTPVFIMLFDSKKVYELKIEVLEKDKIRVPAGEFKTIHIKALMKSEGIFTSKGAIHIWLTDDERKLPVRMRTKAPVGSINADLTGGSW